MRRREVGASSARSLLLTLLGEFVLPRGGRVWTGAFLAAMSRLEVEEKAARKALARTAADGFIRPERVGRKTRWALTEAGTQLLKSGAERIYGFLQNPEPWDGQWLILVVTIPETQRRTRQRLRTRLSWLGAGSPAPGLWVLPRRSMELAVANVIDELDVRANTMSWIGASSSIGRIEDLVADAWSLDEVAALYDAFLESFTGRAARSPHDCFVAQMELVQAWRRFPFLDPALPAEVLGDEWPGPRAAHLFRSYHGRWHERAQQYWDELTDAEA